MKTPSEVSSESCTFLRSYVVPGLTGAPALAAWIGPDAAPQDFVSASVAVEVKTTTVDKGNGLAHTPTCDKLSVTGLQDLYLLHVMLSEVPDGGTTLGELIELIRDDSLGGDTALVETFDIKLLEAGFVDAHSDRYSADYFVSSCSCFRVKEGFPRIDRADVSSGVVGARYSITAAACEPYRRQLDELVKRLSGVPNGS